MLKKIYSLLRDLLVRTNPVRPKKHDWHADPLGHPALQRMSLREIADLPLERFCEKNGR